jgi:microcystin-dependent protein
MFQRIDFTKLGGFPLKQDTLLFIQNSYNQVLQAVSKLAGDYIIISGLTESEPNVYTSGWVTIDGEIIPFEGGTGQPNVSIVESGFTEVFRDNSINEVFFVRKAIFDFNGSIPFSNFKKLSLDDLNTLIISIENLANQAIDIAISATTNSFTAGMIMMWSGDINNIPNGWALCDGNGGRPDLRGRFIVGYNVSDNDYNTIGKIGGSKEVVLNQNQMPSHTHTVQSNGAHTHNILGQTGGDDNNNNNTQRFAGGDKGITESGFFFTNTFACQSSGSHTHTLANTGNNQPHENRPPFYTLAYIIKI